jgi:hypothetical protein
MITWPTAKSSKVRMNVAFEVGLWLPARRDHVEDRAARP